MKTSSFHDSSDRARTPTANPLANDESIAPKSYAVLLADDDEGVSALIKTWLVREGHEVICVFTGAQAERMLTSRPFDIVVTDIVMPDGDGFEVMNAVKRHQPTARTLVISGGGKYLRQPECLKIARGLGATLAISKPFTRDQFLEAFAAVIR